MLVLVAEDLGCEIRVMKGDGRSVAHLESCLLVEDLVPDDFAWSLDCAASSRWSSK